MMVFSLRICDTIHFMVTQLIEIAYSFIVWCVKSIMGHTVKILKFGTPQTITIIVLKIETFNVTLH